MNRIVLTWATLVYLGNQTIDDCIGKFAVWQKAIDYSCESFASSAADILKIMGSVLPDHQCNCVNGFEWLPE